MPFFTCEDIAERGALANVQVIVNITNRHAVKVNVLD
jgi:hypothetical protein